MGSPVLVLDVSEGEGPGPGLRIRGVGPGGRREGREGRGRCGNHLLRAADVGSTAPRRGEGVGIQTGRVHGHGGSCNRQRARFKDDFMWC